MSNPRFVGLWHIDQPLYENENRWYLDSGRGLHEGPVFKFPQGIPAIGDAVHIRINAVECRNRGWMGHRPPIAWQLTVTPKRGDIHDGLEPLRLVSEDPPTQGGVCRVAGNWWLIRGDVEPAEKYDPIVPPVAEPDILRYLDPEYSAALLEESLADEPVAK